VGALSGCGKRYLKVQPMFKLAGER
jgi:hypothetical protein